jgi:hypothetical protein
MAMRYCLNDSAGALFIFSNVLVACLFLVRLRSISPRLAIERQRVVEREPLIAPKNISAQTLSKEMLGLRRKKA